ncbi:hypothetical protein DNTS_013820 [Danionella cerebrum]|uniref:Coiled-coil domain-containing protein n=1 Tax=Danionella cerebrum TaxID=2873325 RepID=A0A553PXT3_9TELE|nr:hypothetical protein DNTS_013820 [Danionella translucida]
MIQEEIQRSAEEAQRREVEDEEIAKRMQDDELCLRSRNQHKNKDYRESINVPARPYSPRYIHAAPNLSRRLQHSSSQNYSDSEEDVMECSRSRVVRQERHSLVDHRRPVVRQSRAHSEQDDKSVMSQSSRSSQLSGGWGGVVKLIKNDLSEQGYINHSSDDEIFEPVYRLEKILQQKNQVSGARLSRHSSMRDDRSRSWQRDGCFRERHVHFPDQQRRVNGSRIYENRYVGIKTERVPSSTGIRRNEERLQMQALPNQTGFQRNVSMRRSYHGNIWRTSVFEGSRTCSADDSNVSRARPSNAAPSFQPTAGDRLREGKLLPRSLSLREDERRIDRDRCAREHRVRRSRSERSETFEEERSSTEEELERERWSQRWQSSTARSPGAGTACRSGRTALDLGDLEQVLRDEELARRLQEEEERLAEEHASSSLRRDGSVGDFRAAQVAQDEEIARFIQKQEIKAKRNSCELELAEREYQEIDRRACDRQRRRLDSEGLQSPVDDFTSDHPTHVSMPVQPQAIRNIAEELDPTFQRKDSADAGKTHGPGQNQASSYSPIDEPTFVPPTKRQSEKIARVKPREKKESAKQKENCKQQ